MSNIFYNEETKMFMLNTPNTSYIMRVFKDKYLAHVHWGRKLREPDGENAVPTRWACMSPNQDNDDKSYTLDVINQEYPFAGGTDYSNSCLDVTFEDGSHALDLVYKEYKIVKGKPKLNGLPATYVEDEKEANTLYVTLEDELKKLSVVLCYTAYTDRDVITRSVQIINNGLETVNIDKVLSANIDFECDYHDYKIMRLPGAWGRERRLDITPLGSGMQRLESKRGTSSPQMNPFIAMLSNEATEDAGEVYAMNFVYSGNFEAGIDIDQIYRPRMFMGINSYQFKWKLESGECFDAPEVVLVYSDSGLGKMSNIFHSLYRKRLVRGKYRDEVRPILVNNWEATYFDFNEEKIINLAKSAKELGIELLVLDDGWFGKRNDDRSSLGDWFANRDKLPNGIEGLSKKVNDIGLKFGLWFEPEMISPVSKLYEEHSDWCLHVNGRQRHECRNQLVLDMTREDVQDYIIKVIGDLLENASIDYIKWDMNRHLTEVGSALLPADRQKEVYHRYVLGLYRVLETLTTKYSNVLFESCSSGGGRFDAGMLYYMPQTWTSDDSDAVERLYIQYGTSMCYPISTMGAHVSAVPNHQLGRVTSLKMRGDVAMSGNFGYELDLTAFTQDEKEIVKAQVEKYKELRTYVQSGDMYRLKNPFTGNVAAWQVISEDGQKVFAGYFRKNAVCNGAVERIKFKALDENAVYEDINTHKKWNGDELMNIGIIVDLWGDFASATFEFRKI